MLRHPSQQGAGLWFGGAEMLVETAKILAKASRMLIETTKILVKTTTTLVTSTKMLVKTIELSSCDAVRPKQLRTGVFQVPLTIDFRCFCTPHSRGQGYGLEELKCSSKHRKS